MSNFDLFRPQAPAPQAFAAHATNDRHGAKGNGRLACKIRSPRLLRRHDESLFSDAGGAIAGRMNW
jgi:hypothetical protein